jgi:hypothetical protein
MEMPAPPVTRPGGGTAGGARLTAGECPYRLRMVIIRMVVRGAKR